LRPSRFRTRTLCGDPAQRSERGSRGWRLVTATPGRLRASCSPALRPVRGVLPLDWDRRQRITPVESKSQEAWPEAEPLGLASLWQEPWWNAGRRARRKVRAATERSRRVTRPASFGVPLPCFLFRSCPSVSCEEREAFLALTTYGTVSSLLLALTDMPRMRNASRERENLSLRGAKRRSNPGRLALNAGLLR
jgi:hypothetical protein